MATEKKAIVVVHGIGDQEQRKTREAVINCCSSSASASKGTTQVARYPLVGPGIQPFSYFAQETEIAGRPVVVAEMYWSDLSRIKTGFLAPLRNFFNLAVAAPDIVYASLGPRLLPDGTYRDYLSLRVMRSLAAIGAWTLFVFLGAFALTFSGCFLPLFWICECSGQEQTRIVPSAELHWDFRLQSRAVLLFLAFRMSSQSYMRTLLRWGASMTIVVSFFIFLDFVKVIPPRSIKEWSELMNQVGIALFVIPGSVLSLFLIVLPLLLLRFPGRWRGTLLALVTVPALVNFWIAFVLTSALILVTNVDTLDQSTEMFGMTSRTLWPMGWLVLFLLGIILLLVGTYAIYRIRSRRTRLTGAKDGHFPRLIVPPLVLAFVVITTIFSVYANWSCMQCGRPPCEGCRTPLWATQWVIANASLVLLLGGLVIQLFPEGFKLASDIVNYFGDRERNTASFFNVVRSTFALRVAGPQSFRGQARDRLRAIIEDVERTFGPVHEIDVVAHSLGSMIAIDALGVERNANEDGKARIRLITLGSPYRNVFNHYFPHQFPNLTRERLAGVAECVNIFRVDDFVGTTIYDARDGFVREISHNAKGHSDYFGDRDVLREFLRLEAKE